MKTINKYVHISLMIIGFVFTNNYCYSRQKMSIVISGEIKGLPDKIKFSIIKGDNVEPSDTIQRTISKNGNFVFKNTGLTNGKMYFIILDTTVFKFPTRRPNWIRFIAEQNAIQISATVDTWPKVELVGTFATKVYEDYHQFSIPFRAEIEKNLTVKNKDSAGLKQAWKNYKEFTLEYVAKNRNSSVVSNLLMKSISLNLNDKIKAYAELPEQAKNSYYGKQFEKFIQDLKIKGLMRLGKEMPDFNIKMPDGKIVAIENLVRKNKLTLIDFWASWCSPCRAAIPHLKEVYKEFNNKGFNIIGVVTAKHDKDVAWKNALAEDKTPWLHGMDLTNTSDVFFPKIAIPGYVLVDDSGKIIATDLIDGGKGLGTQGPGITGKELSKTLESLLGTN